MYVNQVHAFYLGLGETFLLLAKSSVSKSLAFKAAYYLQEAVTVLTR